MQNWNQRRIPEQEFKEQLRYQKSSSRKIKLNCYSLILSILLCSSSCANRALKLLLYIGKRLLSFNQIFAIQLFTHFTPTHACPERNSERRRKRASNWNQLMCIIYVFLTATPQQNKNHPKPIMQTANGWIECEATAAEAGSCIDKLITMMVEKARALPVTRDPE